MTVLKPLVLNKYGNAKLLFDTLKVETEKQGNLKKCSLKKLNDYINPILLDQDPNQEVDESFKNKKNQAFCWKFLRAISYVDQQNFCYKQDKRLDTFDGNVEKLANIVHKLAMKKAVPIAKNEAVEEKET